MWLVCRNPGNRCQESTCLLVILTPVNSPGKMSSRFGPVSPPFAQDLLAGGLNISDAVENGMLGAPQDSAEAPN